MNKNNNKAAREYVARQKKLSFPKGYFDKAGRFHMHASEICICCFDISEPSISHPYSQQQHALSIKHVCNLFDADPRQVRKIVKDIVH